MSRQYLRYSRFVDFCAMTTYSINVSCLQPALQPTAARRVSEPAVVSHQQQTQVPARYTQVRSRVHPCRCSLFLLLKGSTNRTGCTAIRFASVGSTRTHPSCRQQSDDHCGASSVIQLPSVPVPPASTSGNTINATPSTTTTTSFSPTRTTFCSPTTGPGYSTTTSHRSY